MQDDSAHSRTFFHRTNRLVVEMGVQIEDLPRILHLSRRTLFECRSADSSVSAKSWAKLEAAEERASRKVKSAENAASYRYPKELGIGKSTNAAREDPPTRPNTRSHLTADPALISILERIATAIENLPARLKEMHSAAYEPPDDKMPGERENQRPGDKP